MSSLQTRLVRGCLVAGLAWVFLNVPEAHAWIPAVDAMERKLDTQRRPVMNLRIELKSVVKVEEPATLVDIVASKDGRLLLRRHRLADGTVTVDTWPAPQRESKTERRHAPAWLRWFAGQRASALFRSLALDRKTVSLARDGRVVLWVAGATEHQLKHPQVHLERESGIVRRIVETRGEHSVAVSFRGRFLVENSKTHWPRFITFHQATEASTYEILRVVENATIENDEFSPPKAVPSEEAK